MPVLCRLCLVLQFARAAVAGSVPQSEGRSSSRRRCGTREQGEWSSAGLAPAPGLRSVSGFTALP